MPHAEAQGEDEAERRQHDDPDQRRAGDRLVKTGRSGGVSDDTRQCEAAGHVTIDALHIGAQAFIDLGANVGRRAHSKGISLGVGIVVGIAHVCSCAVGVAAIAIAAAEATANSRPQPESIE